MLPYIQSISNPYLLLSKVSTLNPSIKRRSALRVSIECCHKQLQLFKIQLDARTVLVLVIIWGLFKILKIF
jgi:hypothetical protein